MQGSPQFEWPDPRKIGVKAHFEEAMPVWAKRTDVDPVRAEAVTPVVNQRSLEQATKQQAPLRVLSYNIQVGIQTTRYRHYVTNGWKHVLPHTDRADNLKQIADLVSDFDVVALQEIDSGSLRSGFMNQVEYVADRAQFPYWYAQLNRDLGPLAQHGNGLLSRIEPQNMEDHKLPGIIPGRGAIVLRLPYGGEEILVVLLHLSLGERSRQRQLHYVARLIEGEEHVIVMGDMNTPSAKLLDDSPLTDSQLLPVDNTAPTYPAWRPSMQLDHVLRSPSLRVDDFEVLDCQLSDHRPVAVTLSLS